MNVLVTGTAGFIGSAVALRLLLRGDAVVGIDNLNPYYDVDLKRARLARLIEHSNYTHVGGDLADRKTVEHLFRDHAPGQVIHLAAQPGVRFGAANPHAYIDSNIIGFLHILEGCRHSGVEHLVFASTSSVYGADTAMPYSEHQVTAHPLSLYAATKKANEMMAHSYAHLYGFPCTGLRFFTVYGPWGRPDMAPMLFAHAICAGEPINVFNNGQHKRSFTYIDDIVEGVVRVLDQPASPNPQWNSAQPDPATSRAPYRIYNIGHDRPIELLDFVQLLEQALDHKTQMNFLPLQPGDVPDTEADISELERAVGFRPQIPIGEGVTRFAAWYRSYYNS